MARCIPLKYTSPHIVVGGTDGLADADGEILPDGDTDGDTEND
jgi:hypothetical protein